MTKNIHPSAIIHPSAEVAENVTVEAFAVVGQNVKLEQGVKVMSSAYLEYCEIGENTVIHPGAVIGTAPQDLGYKNESTKVVIGANCLIREHATVNRSSGEGNVTRVGDNCLLMTGSHVAHNCTLGNNVILANLATLGGHVLVEDYVFLGGTTVVHQNVRIGEMTILGGFSGIRQDLPPYAKADGRPASIIGLNSVGLKRRELTLEERSSLKKAFNFLWFSDLNTAQAIEKIKTELPESRYLTHLLEFIESSKRGITKQSGKQDSM